MRLPGEFDVGTSLRKRVPLVLNPVFGMNFRKLLTLIFLSFAAAGGIYFGLFSCGGYRWHWHVFLGIGAMLFAWVALAPMKATVWHRLWPLALAPLVFVLAQAASTPFYPDLPQHVSEYASRFIGAFQHGACR
jgi:hypothetical protein